MNEKIPGIHALPFLGIRGGCWYDPSPVRIAFRDSCAVVRPDPGLGFRTRFNGRVKR
jgi:hypothetical protein